MKFSFIDCELQDFLRDKNGEVVIINTSNWEEAESWLLSNGKWYGWTNTGVKYFNWSEEFPD